MATQAFIIETEERVRQMREVIRDIRGTITTECKTNAPLNRLNQENRDCWGTLAVNLEVVGKQMIELSKTIKAKY